METQVALDCLTKQLNQKPNFKAETGVKYIKMAADAGADLVL
jgi:hypothetical protein